jgi:GT2 family glycosyltransferase
MLVIESDIIPPPDALIKLAALNVDCAYGVYRFRQVDVISINERYPEPNTNLGSNLSYERYLLKRAMKLGQYPCTGGGLGCVLIRRRVLEAIEFRVEDLFTAHCDTFFCQDLLKEGFSQAADMSVVCGHKTPEGEILYPNLDWRTA